MPIIEDHNITSKSHLTGVSYDIFIDKLLSNLLPTIYRTESVFNYIRCIFNTLNLFWYNQFITTRIDLIQETRVNGTKIVLEKWLREYFDNNLINIVNSTSEVDLTYIYQEDEAGSIQDNSYIYLRGESPLSDQVYIFKKSEAIVEFDFIVEIPSDVISSGNSITEIKAIVDKFKYMGTSYEIVVI